MKYSITRALTELKLLKNRVNKELYNSSDAFIAVKHGKKLRAPYTSYQKEDFEDHSKKDLDHLFVDERKKKITF